jgi:TetR/AcrR family transcriptional repressor of nem operon
MRYPPEHKTETRQKILKDASRRVRTEGLNGAAVAAVMRDAGLTHGGFYKHFRSKDELLLHSVREAFEQVAASLVQSAEQAGPERAWKAIVEEYLSPGHCDHPERGCPLAALASELARTPQHMKRHIAAEMAQYKERMLGLMPGRRAADKERAFDLIFATMIGAVEVARMMPDRPARERFLASTRDFLLRSF